MDGMLIAKQEEAVIAILKDYVSKPIANEGLEKQLIVDKERHRYGAIVFGWERGEHLVYNPSLYFEIKNGKIWIQQNWTEIEVAKELMARGISSDQIVLGFLHESMRPDTEYAIA